MTEQKRVSSQIQGTKKFPTNFGGTENFQPASSEQNVYSQLQLSSHASSVIQSSLPRNSHKLVQNTAHRYSGADSPYTTRTENKIIPSNQKLFRCLFYTQKETVEPQYTRSVNT